MINAGQLHSVIKNFAAGRPFSGPHLCVVSTNGDHWIHCLSLDKLLVQAFTQIPWFLAFFKSFLLGGAGPLSILWNREEMNSSSPSLTVRTMTWQDEGVRLWSCTEFCPTIPSLLVIRHISWRPMCVCVRYIPNFKNEGETEGERKAWPKPSFSTCVFLGRLFSPDWHQSQPTTSTSDQHLLALRWQRISAWLNADRKKSCVNNIFH